MLTSVDVPFTEGEFGFTGSEVVLITGEIGGTGVEWWKKIKLHSKVECLSLLSISYMV